MQEEPKLDEGAERAPAGVVFPWERGDAYPSWLYDDTGEEPYEPSVRNYGRFLTSGESPWGPGPKPNTTIYAAALPADVPETVEAIGSIRMRCVNHAAGTVMHGIYDRLRALNGDPPFYVEGRGWLSGRDAEIAGGKGASKKWRQSLEGSLNDGDSYERFSVILEHLERRESTPIEDRLKHPTRKRTARPLLPPLPLYAGNIEVAQDARLPLKRRRYRGNITNVSDAHLPLKKRRLQ